MIFSACGAKSPSQPEYPAGENPTAENPDPIGDETKADRPDPAQSGADGSGLTQSGGDTPEEKSAKAEQSFASNDEGRLLQNASSSPDLSAGSFQNGQPENDGSFDDSYFDDAAFIGDSITEAFQLHGGITNAAYYGYKNLNVKDVFKKSLVATGSGKITVADALQNRSYGKYYILLGANELGWVYPQVFVDKYSDLIDLIRQTNPDAVIYLQSVFPVTQHVSDTNPYYSNSRIDEYNQLIQTLAEDKNAIFLNVREAVEDENGILPDDAATDGVHLNKTYCEKWADYLRGHTEETPS